MDEHFILYYADIDLIVELAKSAGVDAVRAGWGHASENPHLPDRLVERGIVFIGPPDNAMRTLGSKISSTIVAQSANVPTMGWSGDGLVTNARNADGMIIVPEDLYLKACVTNVEQAIKIKESKGGSGEGIRKVTDPSQFRAAFVQVAAEVQGSPVFRMRLASNARHLEVQILADAYSNTISLFGRDCSVQRCHQKIIEEAPVTIANPAIFKDMKVSAVRLAKLVGDVNAGIVEFLYDVASNKYYFLEFNPHLQVKHPITEMVSGINLPATQLQVAMGIPLHRIPHVRMLYRLPPRTTSEIDFHFDHPQSLTIQRKPAPTDRVIACRITAENPDAGFKPFGGRAPRRAQLPCADSQFGHVCAYGYDRHSSRRNMITALKELRIRGDFPTTAEILIMLLETDEFANNHFSTEWLDARIQQKLTAERPDRWVSVVTGTATMAFLAAEDQKAQFLKSLEKGQVPTLAGIKNQFSTSFILDGVRYNIAVTLAARDLLRHLDLQQALNQAVDGFEQVQAFASLLTAYLDVIHRPELPDHHAAQVFGGDHDRLPHNLKGKLLDLVSPASSTNATPFLAAGPLTLLATVPDQAAIAPILEVVHKYEAGADAHAVAELNRLIRRFHASESPFMSGGDAVHTEKTVLELRTRMEPETLYWTCFSRSRAAWKGEAIGAVLDLVAAQRSVLACSANVQKLCTALYQLAELGGAAAVSSSVAKAKGAQSVQLRVRALLIAMQLPGFDERYRQFCDVMRAVASLPEASPTVHEEAMNLINLPLSIFDVLPSLLYEHDVPAVDRLIALDMYVRRGFNTHRAHAAKQLDAVPGPLVEWHFQFPADDLGIGNASTAAAGGSAYNNMRTAMIECGDLGHVRVGIMAAVRDAAKLQQHLPASLVLFRQVKAKKLGRTEPWHVLNVAVEVLATNAEDDEANGADADTALSSLFGSLLVSLTAARWSRDETGARQMVGDPPGVWTPASSYRTAQVIRDFGHEGLPLLIFANWRGFLGGQRDMFDAILKFGSYIVDALRTYLRPVFVYIAPHGELRGGARVVLGPSIHQSGGMKMYADASARGGVLEPKGLVEITFRKLQLLATIDCLDDGCRRWKSKVAPANAGAAAADSGSKLAGDAASKKYDSGDENLAATRAALQAQHQPRQESLLPAYHQAPLKFADPHDAPWRMKAKGAHTDG
ncbi:acetyl-coenzyme-A carboxylase [Blastocladiella emersonii ATCC 22665]|nr:acetyl-coenzyme-A carboxylase [Blastocladiella emersonii ATCC 22665]